MNRASLARHLVRNDPALLRDYVRYFLDSKFGGDVQVPAGAPSAAAAIDLNEAHARIRAALGPWTDGPALDLVRRHVEYLTANPGSDETARFAWLMAAESTLCELLYALVRALQPGTVIETGVAAGTTTAYVLAALADNGAGHLHSIDLPTTLQVANGHVAVAVPPSLRDRWTYHWGSSRRLLPPLLARVRGTLDLFIHDSDHRYSAMRWELEQALSSLSPGGWLVADDAGFHSAFNDFSRAVGLPPVYVRQQPRDTQSPGLTGMLSERLQTAQGR
jgi:predicted O-methyltransferase YrrM